MYKLFLLFILLPILIFSQTITNASGTFTNGQTITLTGTSFGTKSPAAPLISSYDNATSANNWSTGSLGGSWTSSGTIGLNNGSPLRTNLYQSSYKIRYDVSGSYKSVRYLRNIAEDKLYISCYWYNDFPTWGMGTGSGNNSKFIRVYQNTSGTGGNWVITLNCNDLGNVEHYSNVTEGSTIPDAWTIAYNGGNAFKYSSLVYDCRTATYLPPLQQWNHVEVMADYPSSLGEDDAIMVYFLNGRTIARSTDLSLNATGQTNNIRWVLFGLVSGVYSPSKYAYIDEIYIDNTPARIFISSTSNIISSTDYGSNNHREIQVPSSWATGSIQFTLNQGTFADNSTNYVYVVTNTGAISNAYEITFGASGGGPDDETAPTAIGNLTVNGSGSMDVTITSISEDCDSLIVFYPDSSTSLDTLLTTANFDTTVGESSGAWKYLYYWAIDDSANVTAKTLLDSAYIISAEPPKTILIDVTFIKK